MNINEDITTVVEEEDVLLPDGWQEGDDIFTENEWTGETQADAPEEEPVQEDEETAGGTEPAPTTEQETGDGIEGEGEAPTTETESETRKLKFTARVDREDLDVEMDESELPTLYQKAQVTDRLQGKLSRLNPMVERAEQLARTLGYENWEAMLNQAEDHFRNTEVARLTGEGVHEEVAKDIVNRRIADKQAVQETAQETPTRDFKAEVGELLSAKPHLQGKPLPESVVQASIKGKRLIDAYADYEAAQQKAEADKQKAEADKLRKENAILKQNAASAARAPVSGTKGGGPTNAKGEDDFMRGFNSDY